MGDGSYGAASRLSRFVRARPTLFSYQYVLRLTPYAQSKVHVEVV